LPAERKHDHDGPDQRVTDADLANTATDFNLTGSFMGKLRTANKRHKRAIVSAVQARRRATATLVEVPAPAKADR
jgi:hypothetical protein